VREAVRDELAADGEDNPVRKQTRRALRDEGKEGGVLSAAAARGAASLQRGMRALEKALQMQQAAQMMAYQHSYGGQQWHGYHSMGTGYAMRDTPSSDGDWRRPTEEDFERRGGGSGRARQHSWGEGQQLGGEGERGASREDLEAVLATLRTPGGPEALRRLNGSR
jgi:hypothetical protein